ncbi:hypothetical protein CA233_06520 [Sphingomonas sp. ABOLD]|nr:hypothetical protein CA233_06520 [Sphingomonas sp. ABOLD]
MALGGAGAVVVAAEQVAGRADGSRDAPPPPKEGGTAGRAALAALDPRTQRAVFLDEEGRSGWFTPEKGPAPEDPLQGLYVAAQANGYHWRRVWDGVHGRPEWFGAVLNDPSKAATTRAAIQACLDSCPSTQLSGGAYFVDGTLTILRNGTKLHGVAHTQTDETGNDARRTTQIVCTSPTAAILRVGADARARPGSLTEAVTLADFSVNRSVGPFTPKAGIEGAIGIELRWIVNCHFVRVFSINSARGWFCYGTVENYLSHCGALRDKPGTNPANDVFVGFHLDYSAPSGFNGGNASLYIDRCRCFPLTGRSTPPLTASYGIYLDKGWVDLWIDGFESGAGIEWGIYGIGTGVATKDFKTEDLFIRNCVLDPGGAGCIRLADAGVQTQVHIIGNYLAPSGSGTGIVLEQVRGSVTIANNQFVVAAAGTATGVAVNGGTMTRLSGNSYLNLRQPIVCNSAFGISIEDTIQSVRPNGDYPAVGLRGNTRSGFVRCMVGGREKAYTAGVLVDGSVSDVEVNASAIQEPVVAPGGRIQHGGITVRSPGPFGAGCLASGIVG